MIQYVSQASKWLEIIEKKAELYGKNDPIRRVIFDRIEALYIAYVVSDPP